MKNASQNGNVRTSVADGKAAGRLGADRPGATDVMMRVAAVAALADQCKQEGNPGTADSLRRLARALWGKTARRNPPPSPED